MKPLEELTDKEILDAEKEIIEREPLLLVSRKYLKIKTKEGTLEKLALNSAQKLLLERIEEQRADKMGCKIWVLKARQEGVSTLSEAIIYALTSQQENRNALILANELDNSNNLFEKSKLYHEMLTKDEPHLAPIIKKSNEKKLEFEGRHSQIIIQTAEKGDEAGRSHTFQYVHLSECAFFTKLKDVLSSLSACVPEHWDTLIIGETTANGMNAFYDEWMRAIQGKTDWIPFFIPFFWMSEYVLPLQDGHYYSTEGINFEADQSLQDFLDEELMLMKEYRIKPEAINWRRYSIINKCGGSVRKFKQEYPAYWQEAFAMTGDNTFDKKGLEWQAGMAKEPISYGNFYKESLKWVYRPEKNGRFEMFEYVQKSDQYIIAVDASEAIGKDPAGLVVLNKRTNNVVCIASGQYESGILAEMAIQAGNYYNNAIIAPESKGYGAEVCRLIHENYGNIYRKHIFKDGSWKETEELGFNTNSQTRPLIIAELGQEIADKACQLVSKKLVEECQTFVNHFTTDGKFKKAEASVGKHDELVICRAIAGFVRNIYPYKPINNKDIYRKKAFVEDYVKQNKNGGFGRKCQ